MKCKLDQKWVVYGLYVFVRYQCKVWIQSYLHRIDAILIISELSNNLNPPLLTTTRITVLSISL